MWVQKLRTQTEVLRNMVVFHPSAPQGERAQEIGICKQFFNFFRKSLTLPKFRSILLVRDGDKYFVFSQNALMTKALGIAISDFVGCIIAKNTDVVKRQHPIFFRFFSFFLSFRYTFLFFPTFFPQVFPQVFPQEFLYRHYDNS